MTTCPVCGREYEGVVPNSNCHGCIVWAQKRLQYIEFINDIACHEEKERRIFHRDEYQRTPKDSHDFV